MPKGYYERKQKKKPSVAKLKKKLDAVFSKFIRKRDGTKCFTCGARKPIDQLQAGHFVSRSHNILRYDEQNVHAQCIKCNMFLAGNMVNYAIKMQELYGDDILKKLRKKSLEIKQFTVKELEDLIDKYQKLL